MIVLARCKLVGLLLLSLPAFGADWPQFRGPTGMGTSADRDVPIEFSTEQNVVWKTELPGPGASSPIIKGDRIFLTCYTGYSLTGERRGEINELTRHLVCLQRDNGKLLWNVPVEAEQPESDTIREDHGYASSTPAADDERVYVLFGRSGVFAFDHSGHQLWHRDVGERINAWGSAASPLLIDDLLIVNASVESESLIALDKATGEQVWRVENMNDAWNMPVVVTLPDGGRELVLAKMGFVLGLDPKTGEQLWTCDTDIGWYMVPSLVSHEGIVYCIGGRSGGSLAVRVGGRGDVTNTHRIWTGTKGSNVSSPVYHDGHLYWVHDNLGIAYCADASTGDVLYEKRLEDAGQVYASTLLVGNHLFYLARNGRMFVVAAQPQFELLATNDMDDGSTFNATPAVADGKLYLRSDNYLYCIGH